MHTEEQIKLIANTLLPGFIPKNLEEKELTFHFTIPPDKSYKVWYKRGTKNEWEFTGFDQVNN